MDSLFNGCLFFTESPLILKNIQKATLIIFDKYHLRNITERNVLFSDHSVSRFVIEIVQFLISY